MPRGRDEEAGANVFLILLAIFLPPLAVIIKTHGDGVAVGINLLLTILGWIPGVLHAWYIISRPGGRQGVAIVADRPSHGHGSSSGHKRSSNKRGHRHSGVNYGGGGSGGGEKYYRRETDRYYSSSGGGGGGGGGSRRSHSARRAPEVAYVVPAAPAARRRSRSGSRGGGRYYVEG